MNYGIKFLISDSGPDFKVKLLELSTSYKFYFVIPWFLVLELYIFAL
jgi:hypothetical protein